MIKRSILVASLGWLVVFAASCSTGSEPDGSASSTAVGSNADASLNKEDYPVFPDADAGADPAVPAEQGGKGFSGKGWETNISFDLIGDPRAAKGGVLKSYIGDFPGTFRIDGPDANNSFMGFNMMPYEFLLGMHPTTDEFIPGLATHWQISDDKMTYRFRINPNARFADGTPVTADDVVASFDFLMDETLQAPMTQLTYSKLEHPVAESKYMVRVKAKELNWRNFLYFSNSMPILPSHVLKTVNGATYLKEYNFKQLPGSGPYVIREEDIVKGKSVTIRRRPDYWAANYRANVGLYNFDELRFVVVRDDNLALEMFKKGELDYIYVPSARLWVTETNYPNIQRGLVQKRKIFNDEPRGTFGIALNTRRPPFDDIRVRKAFALLFHRELMIEKLAFNQYLPLNSYHPASVYENINNPKTPYDPEQALKLLAEAGWKERDSRGRLVKNGQPLEVELMYPDKTWEQYFTIYQEDLGKVGITLNLRLITPEALFSATLGRRFQMAWSAWSGLHFPNNETSFHSKLADVPNNNNITGFKNARFDELCKLYDQSFDVQERIRIVREMDSILANEYHYVLFWYGPYSRLTWWNKFGYPPGYISRTGDYVGQMGPPGVPQMWWIDSEKQARLEQALRDPSMKLEVGPEEDHYWIEYGKRQQAADATQ